MSSKHRSGDTNVKKFKFSSSTSVLAVTVTLFCGSAQALEVGFEGLVSFESRQNTDNIEFADDPDLDNEFGTGLIGVFGEHRSRELSAGFSGELETERNLSDDNDTYDTDTRFIGVLDVAITPRTLRWFFGDVLSGTRNDDAVLITDDINENTVNIFITGPSYQSEIEGVGSTSARLFYVYQTEDNEPDRSLYNFSTSHQRETTVGSFYGVRFNDIYTVVEDDPDPAFVALDDEDFNRLSLTVFTNRALQRSDLYGEVGVTRYTTDDDAVDSLTAGVRTTHRMGPRTTLTAGLTHNLNDEVLNTIETLFRGDADNAGLQPEVDGIFAETRLDVAYAFDKRNSELEVGLSIAQLDYQLLTSDASQNILVDGEDRIQGTLNVTLAKNFTNRLSAVFAAAYELEEYQNRGDNTDAYQLTADFSYALTRSFSLEFLLAYDAAKGLNTRGTVEDPELIPFDETETSAIIGVRWSPVTRASREMTVDISSLLE